MADRESRGLPRLSKRLAGEVGIEPTNAGIKIRCLTTWRLPSSSTRHVPQGMPVQAASDKSAYVCGQLFEYAPRLKLGRETAEHASSGAGHGGRAEALEPVE